MSGLEAIKVGPDDVLVFRYAPGSFDAVDHVERVLKEADIDRMCICLPDGFDIQTMPLDGLREFRDRLSAVIRERERKKHD